MAPGHLISITQVKSSQVKGAMMKDTRRVVRILGFLLFSVALTSPMWLYASAAGSSKDAVSSKDAASATKDPGATKDAASTPAASSPAPAPAAAANPHAGHMMDMAAPLSDTPAGFKRKGMSMHVPDWSKRATGVAATATNT